MHCLARGGLRNADLEVQGLRQFRARNRSSGAVPGLFKPVEIDGALFVDGGMVNKAPVQALADLVQPEKMKNCARSVTVWQTQKNWLRLPNKA